VAVDNDSSAAALAEKLFGEARDARDFVVIAGHSGIGGALYLGGRLYRGSGGFAGEIGHVRVEARRAALQLRRPRLSGGLPLRARRSRRSSRERGRRSADAYDAIAAAAAGGDATVLALLAEVGTYLGRVIADVIDVLDPELVVLAGPLSQLGPWLLPALERVLAGEALAGHRGECRVVRSTLGAEAVTMGGVGLAMEAVLSLPTWLLEHDGVLAQPAW
jgi:predicted NBD/HSP70 family sugar kinase